MMKPETLLKKEPVIVILAMICCLLWGSAFPCVKIGYALFGIDASDSLTQILFAGIRFFFAGALTIAIGSITEKKLLLPHRGAGYKIVILALFQTVLQYIFFYLGLARTTGVKGSIITASNVFIAILISAVIFRMEKLTWKKLLGCALGFMGVVIINLTGNGLDLSFDPFGDGLVVISATAYAFASAFIKLFSKNDDPVMLSGYQFMLGGAVMIIAGLAGGGRITVISPGAILMLIYLSFLSAVAFSLWGLLLKYNPVSKITVYGFMNPVFGVILSSVFLSESGMSDTSRVIISLLLISAGIIIVNYRGDHS